MTSDPRLRTRATELFGVDVPLVQTGMGWVAGPSLVSATAEAGALGILAAATLSFEEMVAAIDEIRRRTDRPFGVNLRTDADDVDRRVDHLIRAGVRVASFAQAPRRDLVGRLQEAGLVVVPTIGAR
ncbi:MAG: nitronate monooxygenase, partial [Actinomyces sp.]